MKKKEKDGTVSRIIGQAIANRSRFFGEMIASDLKDEKDEDLWTYLGVERGQIVFDVTTLDATITKFTLRQMLLGPTSEAILDDMEKSKAALKNLRKLAQEFERQCAKHHGDEWKV